MKVIWEELVDVEDKDALARRTSAPKVAEPTNGMEDESHAREFPERQRNLI